MRFILQTLRSERMINGKSCRLYLSALVFMLILPCLTFAAGEDTAQLTFRKTAVSQKKSHPDAYTVRHGEVLSSIIRTIPGITEKDVPRYYRLTRELNPEITDIDKIYAGQTIILPTGLPDSGKGETNRAASRAYKIRKGDTLLRIVYREMGVTSRAWDAVRAVQAANPRIIDVNKIYEGQTILLPEGGAAILLAESPSAAGPAVPDPQVEKAAPEEAPAVLKAEPKGAVVLPPAQRLAAIKHIITKMKGNMMTSGNYYLPVSDTEQLTIDCSVIPVVELDGRTTVFLDTASRSSTPLKKLISEHWKNYHLIKINDQDDIIIVLKKIFKNTPGYEISKAQKPLVAGSAPSVEIVTDWVITKKISRSSSHDMLGIRFVGPNDALLPRAVVNYAAGHSLAIVEVSPEKGIVEKPQEIYSLPPVVTLPSSPCVDFAWALITHLNIQAERNIDVRTFNIDQDGFNLSVKADISVTDNDRRTLVFARTLPEQFIEILQKTGDKLIFLSDDADPAANMERILKGMNLVYTTGYFNFSGPDKNQAPYHFGFMGTKIKTDKNIYIVNFDLNRELRGLLHETWEAEIVQY